MGNINYYLSKIGYGNNTTCIQSTNLELIKHNLSLIFKKEGYSLISKLTLPSNADYLIKELFSSPYKTKPYLWVIGLSASNSGWTTIKTSVEDLLCRRAKTNNYSRLSDIAILSNCNVFHHSVHSSHSGVIVEANSVGKTLATGYLDECDDLDSMQFYGEPVLEPKGEQNFNLLDVSEALQMAGRVEMKLSEQEKIRKNEELETIFQGKDQDEIKKAVAEWKKLNMGWIERFDRDLGNLICNSKFFWQEDNIFYKSYTESEKLNQNKIEVLFFQISRFNLDSTTEEIWFPIKNFNWLDYSKDLKKNNLQKKYWQ
ncbi:MAG: hypothetical protein AAFQ80_06545 [Cyanobacteria bacterium J06621_8]